MSVALLYLPCLPSVSWLMDFASHERIVIENEENFIKATFRNRYEIAGPNGRILLTVPVEGGREKRQKYKEVRICYRMNWQKIHWQSIRSAYGRAPFFEYYSDKFEAIYQKQYDSLFNFNMLLLEQVLGMLRISKDVGMTTSFERMPADVIDLRTLDDRPERNLPRYYQVFEERNGFISNLSIMDLLFHLGPGAKNYLLNL